MRDARKPRGGDNQQQGACHSREGSLDIGTIEKPGDFTNSSRRSSPCPTEPAFELTGCRYYSLFFSDECCCVKEMKITTCYDRWWFLRFSMIFWNSSKVWACFVRL